MLFACVKLRGPWTSKETAHGITSLPVCLAGPRHLAIYAVQRWAIENREHYVTLPSGRTSRERAPETQPNAYAGIRNLIGAFGKKGHANITSARRCYGRTISASSPSTDTSETGIKNMTSLNTNTPGPWFAAKTQ
jgi:hypothetical protein